MSSDRIGIEPRRQAHLRTRQALLSKPILLAGAGLAAFILVIFIGGQAALGLTGGKSYTAVSAFFLGSVLTCVPWLLWSIATTIDGSWSWRVGAITERWTADALRQLGGQWRFQYNVVFYEGKVDDKKWVTDIDCVAIGPAGVLVVSTKWTTGNWDLDHPTDEFLVTSARRAARLAELISGPLRPAVPDPPIIPVLMCWSPRSDPISGTTTTIRVPGQRYPDVVVVNGDHADEWLRSLDAHRLAADQVATLDQVVADRIRDYEERHRRDTASQTAAQKSLVRSSRTTAATVVVTIAALAWLVTSMISHPVLVGLDRFARLGGGLAAALYVTLPFLLPTAAAAYAQRCYRQAIAARIRTRRRIVVYPALAAAVWALAMTAAFIVR
jgi:hypothetical protein